MRTQSIEERISETFFTGNNKEGAKLFTREARQRAREHELLAGKIDAIQRLIAEVIQPLNAGLSLLDPEAQQMVKHELHHMYGYLCDVNRYFARQIKDSTKETNEKAVRDNHNMWWVEQAEKKHVESVKLLEDLSRYIRKLCAKHLYKTDTRTHYELLAETDRTNRDEKKTVADTLSSLLVYRREAIRNSEWRDFEAGLGITEIPLKTTVEKVGFSILPQKTVETRWGNAVETIPFKVLQLPRETLHTACVLYVESDLDFKKVLEIAERM